MLVAVARPPLVIGGVGLFAGVSTLLIAVLLPITYVGSAESVGPIFKNVALLGALGHFWAHGAGGFSVDAARRSGVTSA